jgi:WD40 repeat protein
VTGRDAALAAMSSDGRLLLLGDYAGRVTIWNTETGQIEWELHPTRYLTAAAFSRDGRLLAIAPGSPVQVYDVGTRQLVRELQSTAGTTSVVFSRDGASLASTDGDGVRIYDVRSGSLTATNTDFLGVPLAAEFSNNGKYVVAAGGDRVVLVLDATTGKTLRRSARLPDPVFYLEVSPNGREVAVVTQNADDPQHAASVVFAAVPSLTTTVTWRSPAGVLLPGAAWSFDGHFLAATQSAGIVHVWTIR